MLALLVALGFLTGCMNAEEMTFFDRANALRAAHGLPAYHQHQVLDDKAQAWARKMAAENKLYHSRLQDGMGGVNWRYLGENVGKASPGHWGCRAGGGRRGCAPGPGGDGAT